MPGCPPRIYKLTLTLVVGLLLAACRAGGGDASPGDDITELTLHGDRHSRIGEVVGIVATLPDAYRHYQWTQLSGTPVTLPDRHGPALSFRVPAPGFYGFRFRATASDGATLQADFALEAAAGEPARAALRADRAVSAGGRTSLRFWLDDRAPAVAPTFRQVSGPSATLSYGSDPAVLYLTAPDVPGDRVLEFEARVETEEGAFSDRAWVLVRNRPPVTSLYFCRGGGPNCATTVPLQEVRPHRPHSAYRQPLQRCIYDNQLNGKRLCRIAELPPLGQGEALPSVERIMDRVLVSHDWMGERFEALLQEPALRQDLRHLLRPVTAVVIASDVRPSFYWALTGAIYLDSRHLWRTPEERDLINEQPDARAGFGDELPVRILSRFNTDGQQLPGLPGAGERVEASQEQWLPRLGITLYHELAHANDYLPPSTLDGLAGNLRMVDEINRRLPVSDNLPGGPRDAGLTDLARVRFFGTPATEAQKQLDPGAVAGWFFEDVTNDFYAYASPREDLAMLVEDALMGFRLGYSRDLAVTDTNLVVRQGWRHRIAQDGVKERVGYVLNQIYPEQAEAVRQHLNTLAPQPLCDGVPFSSSRPNCATAFALPYQNGLPEEATPTREHFSPPLVKP